MTVSGTWNARNLYTGSAKWGTGTNPIHSFRDSGNPEELAAKNIPIGFANDAGTVPEELVEDFGYIDGDYYGAMEDPRMVDSHPLNKPYPRDHIPDNYPEWGTPGVEREEDSAWRSIQHESAMESFTFVGVTPAGQNVTGGWLNKQRGMVNHSVTSAPTQYEMNTSMTQGPEAGVMLNTRAQLRGLDARAPIESRQAGMKAKYYAKDWEQGGGQATPRMRPYQQDQLRRPFYYRSAGLSMDEQHMMNTMEGRQTLQYVAPDSPDNGQDATQTSDNYGYTSGDYYG